MTSSSLGGRYPTKNNIRSKTPVGVNGGTKRYLGELERGERERAKNRSKEKGREL